MSSLPPPPLLTEAVVAADVAPPLRPWQLTGGWRLVFGLGWAGAILGFVAVATVSRTMGLSTWWLGASAFPRPLYVQALPFVPSVLLVIAAGRNVRHLPPLGIAGGVLLGLVAWGDLGRFDRLGVIEGVIALAAVCVTVACFAGLARPQRSATPN